MIDAISSADDEIMRLLVIFDGLQRTRRRRAYSSPHLLSCNPHCHCAPGARSSTFLRTTRGDVKTISRDHEAGTSQPALSRGSASGCAGRTRVGTVLAHYHRRARAVFGMSVVLSQLPELNRDSARRPRWRPSRAARAGIRPASPCGIWAASPSSWPGCRRRAWSRSLWHGA